MYEYNISITSAFRRTINIVAFILTNICFMRPYRMLETNTGQVSAVVDISEDTGRTADQL